MQEPSGPGGKIICFILVEISYTFISSCHFVLNLYVYLSQAVTLPAPIRIKSDLFLCTHPVQEVQLEPAVVTCRVVVLPSPAEPPHSRHEHRGETRPVQRRIAFDPPSLVIGGALGCRNPAHLEVRPLLRYLVFFLS